jgi:nucleoporin POM152
MADSDSEDTVAIEFTGTAPWSVVFEIKHDSGASTETVRVENLDKEKAQVKIPREYLRLGGQSVRIRQVSDALGCRRTYEAGGPSVQVQLYEAPSIYPLDQRKEYCIGERLSYTLVGTPPFEVGYTFDGALRHAKSQTTTFKRLAEAAGEFTITSISDKASECRAAVNITKTIHPFPTVRIVKGKTVESDIHEGGEVEISFDFTGTPPFEFTYTRSTNARKGQRSQVLETRHDVSYEYSKVVRASLEGTYEVVSIKDMHCAFSTQQVEGRSEGKMLTY